MWSRCDENADGTIDFQEFLSKLVRDLHVIYTVVIHEADLHGTTLSHAMTLAYVYDTSSFV